ncbi:MAG: 3-isopropylmalate dehydratase small subunit [Kiritimatiellaceae bacterium]|nr:3-isopropylmalate dehydratase small subunit [Kiritimatiellaceae bacterium]RZO86489.1 MAG: 3-isopropylmalate dehydratase small subunit [Kiritimatiellaceae bacterium]|tara:strand:- start:1164 stop:1784 length:621 start_codon:yes stop_codon:yes gene_type:complete
MEKFETFTGTICAVDRANIDTDALIPKEHLKSIKRTGFGPALFSDWRYNADGSNNPNFALNHPKANGASILVGRNNFGCGSSREHAVWAVAQQGFKVVIAPREGEIPAFADIFRNNCAKNGLLTIELTNTEIDHIFQLAEADQPLSATVNLEEQTLTFDALTFHFQVDPAVREKLLLGMDDIAESLSQIEQIQAFEQIHNAQLTSN